MRFLTVRSRFQSGIEHEFKQRSVTCPYSYPLQPPLTLLSWRRNAILRSYAANVSDPRTSYVPRLSPRPPLLFDFSLCPFQASIGQVSSHWPPLAGIRKRRGGGDDDVSAQPAREKSRPLSRVTRISWISATVLPRYDIGRDVCGDAVGARHEYVEYLEHG